MASDPRRSRWGNWGLVPGPADFIEPFYSTELGDEIAQYDPACVAELTLRIPGMQFTHAAAPRWWDWRARWANESGSHITFEMTLFDVDLPSFGGFNLDADCTPSELLHLWNALRHELPRLWLHSADCRLYKPDSFRAEYLA